MNWKAIGAFLVTAFGVVSSPAVLHLIPPQYSALVVAVGAIIQATSDAVHHGPGTVVPGTTDSGQIIPKGTEILPTTTGSGVRLSTGIPVISDK